MLSQDPRNQVPGCAACGLGPDEAIHRLHPGHKTHAFALTPGEAARSRLEEAHARAAAAPPFTMLLIAPDAASAEREQRRILASEQLELGGTFEGPPLHEVIAEQLDNHWWEDWSPEDRGGFRLAICDALRARLRGLSEARMRQALEDFFRAPEVLR